MVHLGLACLKLIISVVVLVVLFGIGVFVRKK
jgi:hypothetical protein